MLRFGSTGSGALLGRRWVSVRVENDDSFSMDARLLLVTAPILLAVAWAVFNIGRAAVGQLQLMLKRSRA